MTLLAPRQSETPSPADALVAACAGNGRAYEPAFALQRCDTGIWLCDKGRPIAYIHDKFYSLDAFEFSPFYTRFEKPVIHPRYEMGTYINMHAMLFHAVEGNHRWPTGDCHMAWTLDSGDLLQLEIHADYRDGQRTTNILTVDYDEQVGQYRYRIHKRLWQREQNRVEFCNVYPKNLSNADPAQKKWQYTLWAGANGQPWKMPHTPALTYGMLLDDKERMKRLATNGWIGWGAEDDFNLAVVIENATLPVFSETCDMWFDEHLKYEEPGMECRSEDGYVTQTKLRLLDVPVDVMRSLIEQAQEPAVDRYEATGGCGPAFMLGQINDLENAMDPRVPVAGQMWDVRVPRVDVLELDDGDSRTPANLEASRHVAWVDDCGHSGHRSIRLRGLPGRVLRLAPVGQSLHVRPNAVYQFEGWIKTRNAVGRLWIGQCWRNWRTFYGEVESNSVGPDSDWTHVSVQLRTTDYPYVLCRLAVTGDGEAWFDDLHWHEVV